MSARPKGFKDLCFEIFLRAQVVNLKIVVEARVPWVPEPQNLNERKLVREKERRKKGCLSFLIFFFLLFFGSGTQGKARVV